MDIDLKRISLFSSFTDEELNEIKKFTSIKTYKAGDILFYEQEEPQYLFLLLSGKINLYKTNSKGRQLYIHTIEAIDFVGEISAFKNVPFSVTAECATCCEILKINYHKIDKNIFEKFFFCKKLIDLIYNKMLILMNVIDNSFLTSQERVVKLILNDVSDFDDATYTNIAKKLNMTPETLSRILNKLKKEGYINIDKNHKIKIVSKQDLKKICD